MTLGGTTECLRLGDILLGVGGLGGVIAGSGGTFCLGNVRLGEGVLDGTFAVLAGGTLGLWGVSLRLSLRGMYGLSFGISKSFLWLLSLDFG